MAENRRQDSHQEDYVPADDVIIGRAFRWSLLGIAAIVLILAVLFFISGDQEPGEAVREIDAQAPRTFSPSREGMPKVSFTDITDSAGIGFVHNNGATGDKYLPETMGGGVAFLDYDGDGDADLLFVNSQDWPWAESPRSATMVLYANDGSGRFVDVTRETGLALSMYGMGAAVGDYDNDGDVDVFLTAVGSNLLLENDGGRFSDVTGRAGVSGDDQEWSSSAAFLDYDGDGLLDLFVSNYVRWSREIDLDLNFTLNGTDRAYGPPTSFTGTHPYLYRNKGDGTFEDVSQHAGIRVENPATGNPMSKALALLPVDLERDGSIDIVMANDTVQNVLFHNRGDGTFEEIGAEAGLAYDFNGNATGAMGVDAGYHRNDDTLAIGIANFANEMSSLYVSQDDPTWFADESIGEGIGSQSRLKLSFGLFFFDYDLDGRLDLLQANGHLEEEITEMQASQHYEQAAQLFWNQGPGEPSCYIQVPENEVGDLSRKIVGRGASYADIDADGDLDVVLTQTGRRPLLLRNDQDLGHKWIRFRLIGTRSNRDAIGAWVEVVAGGITQRRPVMPTRSYLSQVELPVTFGLGDADRIESVEIWWPDGTTQTVEGVEIGTTVVVEQL